MRNKTMIFDREAYMYFIDKNNEVKEVKGTIHIDHIEGTFLGKNVNQYVSCFTYINEAGDMISEMVSVKEGRAECKKVWLLKPNKTAAMRDLAANLIHSAQMLIDSAERYQKEANKLLDELRLMNEE